MPHAGRHELVLESSDATRDMHRAVQSLIDELEAVDGYNQRVDVCRSRELGAFPAHNRDEENEHAAMLLEWNRRNDGGFDHELRDCLFTDKSLTHDRGQRRRGARRGHWAAASMHLARRTEAQARRQQTYSRLTGP